MRTLPEIEIPELKPAIESVAGRWVQKVSPRRTHAALQKRLLYLFDAWAGGRGEALAEWRFNFNPPGDERSSLVPDVGYLSFARVPADRLNEREVPAVAPDIAVEVLSPGDWRPLIDTKIRLYLEGETALVIVVDPASKTVEMHERDGTLTFGPGERATARAFPDFTLEVNALFDRL